MHQEYHLIKFKDSIRDTLVLIEVHNDLHDLYVLKSNYTPDINLIEKNRKINTKWFNSCYSKQITKEQAELCKLLYLK